MAEPLIHVTRGKVIECIHRGDVVVVNNRGDVLYYSGDPFKYTYMRSAAKPIQALNVILSGAAKQFELSSRELAIICSSHYAEEMHLKTVQNILEKVGLSSDSLLAGASVSINKEIALKNAREKKDPSSLQNDCSGKHAGMLATCKYKGYPIDSYLSDNHPVQQEILSILSDICDYPSEKILTGIDGCSVPVHALPLFNMALGYARLTNPENLENRYKTAISQVVEAMIANPFMIAGTNGFCTDLIANTNGKLIGKIGAEGIYCVGIKEKNIGIAVKIEDGNMNMLPPVVTHVLKTLRVLSADELNNLEKYIIMDNLNDSGNKVGEIKPAFKLNIL